MGSNNRRGSMIYMISVALLLMLAFQYVSSLNTKKPTEYNQVIQLFQQNKVDEYTLDFNNRKLTYILREERELAKNESRDPKAVEVTVPDISLFVKDVHDVVKAYNETHPDNPVTQIYIPLKDSSFLVNWLPLLLSMGVVGAMMYILMRQTKGAGSPLSFSKAKAKQPDDRDKVTFDDVAGADEEKAELEEIVDFLKSPERYNHLGARIPRGVLLMGPPGTGKTLLGKAVAGEAGVPFFSISGSDFVEMYVGVGASRVRDLFEQAKKNAPSIVFIDEIDAVGRHRGAGLGGGHDEREQTLNQLLVEMDGFGTNSGVIVMAATNRKDILDPALMRPGRFDRQITVSYPDVKGREEILRVHTRNKPIGPDVDLAVIARTTSGFTGADLENLANESALLAARRHKKSITMEEIEEATIKVVMGPEKTSHVVTEKERNLTAYHEAGHAIVTYFCPSQDKVHQVSIIPRGMAGGFTLSLPEKDITYRTKTEMAEDICTLLGGRVAEQLVLGDISTGASNDIERATKLARAMVMRFGFSEELGPMIYGKDQNEVFLGMDIAQNQGYSEEVAAIIDKEVRKFIDDGYERAITVLNENMEKLHQLADYLKEFEKIDGEVFERFMSGEMNPEEMAEAARSEAEIARERRIALEKRIAEAEQRKTARNHQDPPGHTRDGKSSSDLDIYVTDIPDGEEPDRGPAQQESEPKAGADEPKETDE